MHVAERSHLPICCASSKFENSRRLLAMNFQRDVWAHTSQNALITRSDEYKRYHANWYVYAETLLSNSAWVLSLLRSKPVFSFSPNHPLSIWPALPSTDFKVSFSCIRITLLLEVFSTIFRVKAELSFLSTKERGTEASLPQVSQNKVIKIIMMMQSSFC